MDQPLTEEALIGALEHIWQSIPQNSAKTILMNQATANRVERAMREGNALRRYYRNPIFRNLTIRQVNRATGKVRLPAYEPMTAKRRRR